MIFRATLICLLAAFALALGCEDDDQHFDSSDDDDDDDGSTDGDSDGDSDSDSDSDSDTDTEYTGPAIPETCAQAEQATTTVGCLFYAVDLDSHDSVETQQYAVAVSNVNQTQTAHVTIYKGNAGSGGWDLHSEADVDPMSLHQFNLEDYHMDGSGVMPKGSYKVESDVPIIAYQFNPVDGASSYLSDASMLIPVPSLSQTYDVIGWKQSCQSQCDGDMRAYFTVVAVEDGTQLTINPSVAPLAGGVVPGTATQFYVDLDEGDVLEVETNGAYDSLSGTRIESNDNHPIIVFSGQECAFIPFEVYACDHLEEQLPGMRFWGKEFVAARMPVRSSAAQSEMVLWQIYASEADTDVTLSASSGVLNMPFTEATLEQGQLIEFAVNGSQAQPGDFFVQADKPIAVMQYMIGSENENCGSIGDPAMVYNSPTEQFLNRYVVLVPGTWINDALVVTRHAGVQVDIDGVAVPDSSFVDVAGSGYEVARIPIDDGIHTLESADESKGLAVIVVGYDQWDSYAYAGGMGMGEINPVVE
jgi:hypothetical protein